MYRLNTEKPTFRMSQPTPFPCLPFRLVGTFPGLNTCFWENSKHVTI